MYRKFLFFYFCSLFSSYVAFGATSYTEGELDNCSIQLEQKYRMSISDSRNSCIDLMPDCVMYQLNIDNNITFDLLKENCSQMKIKFEKLNP